MRQSNLFTKTRKEAPKDEVSKNAILLIRGGFINKEMAGVYSYLPLGLRVLKKIERVIREEMNTIGGQEIEMTTLQDSEIWKKADKWDDEKVDVWFKTKLKNGSDLGLAFSHEEVIAEMLKNHTSSYKDLPFSVYQFQTKFRNELRAKSGIMRGREFFMKDMYSFSRTENELMHFYEEAKKAYFNIVDRVGLKEKTYLTRADGSVFGPWSDEFQVLSEAGEDTIFIDKDKKLAINKEVFTDETIEELGLVKDKLEEKRSVEIGNIFPIGTRVSDAIGFTYSDEKGENHPVVMGSYGIGLGRLMGTIVEVLSDGKGIVWPDEIAPFKVHLIALSGGEKDADKLYEKLLAQNTEVLYDDRQDISAGQKFADSDLIGIPLRVVVSERSLKAGGFEIKRRSSDKEEIIKINNLPKWLNG